MKKFIKNYYYYYLLYFIISIIIFTHRFPIVGSILLELLVRLREKVYKNKPSGLINKLSILLVKNLWAFHLATLLDIYGLKFFSFKYWIVGIITAILIRIRSGEFK